MTKIFLLLYDFLNRHRKASLASLILLFILFIVLASRVHYEEDIAKFLPQSEQNDRFHDIYERTSLQNRIAVLFTPRVEAAVANEDSIEMAMEFVGQELSKIKGIDHLQVRVDGDRIANLMRFIYQNIPYFLKDEDYRRIDSL